MRDRPTTTRYKKQQNVALKTYAAKRVQGHIENVLNFAIVHKYRVTSNPARWREHLDMLLANPSRVKTIRHHPAMLYEEILAYMTELSLNGSVLALALRL